MVCHRLGDVPNTDGDSTSNGDDDGGGSSAVIFIVIGVVAA
jgi:hypothetical protein